MDLGCGYGKFNHHIHCRRKLALDLNPRSLEQLKPDVELLAQDAALHAGQRRGLSPRLHPA